MGSNGREEVEDVEVVQVQEVIQVQEVEEGREDEKTECEQISVKCKICYIWRLNFPSHTVFPTHIDN